MHLLARKKKREEEEEEEGGGIPGWRRTGHVGHRGRSHVGGTTPSPISRESAAHSIESAGLAVQTYVARPCPTAAIRGATAEKSPRPAPAGRPPRREVGKQHLPGASSRAFVPTPGCETASRTAELPPSLSLDGAVWVSAQARDRPRGNAPDRRGHAPDSAGVCGRGYGMSRRTTTSANLWRGGVEGRPIPAGRRALRGWVTNY